MKKTSAALLAMSLAASILLAACGGDTKPDAASSSTTGASPTLTTPAPTTTAPTQTTSNSPTTLAAPTIDPNIPAAARAHTPAGSEYFVRYFYAQLNIALSRPQGGLISALSATTCKTCTALEQSAVDLASKHHHYRGDAFAVGTVAPIGESEILVVGQQPPGAVIDSNGSVIESTTEAKKSKFVVAVAWSSTGWRIKEIKVLR